MKTNGIVAALLATLTITSPSWAQKTIAVSVNGEFVGFSGQPPIQQNGRLLVPLRGVLEKIGATVRYSGPTKTIRATKGDTNIELVLGERTASVGGKSVDLDVPAQAVNGTTLVPLRFVAESLGADVLFDGPTQIVAIRTDGKPNVISAAQPTPAPSPTTVAQKKTLTGVFVDFSAEDDQTYTLKMTDGSTIVLRKDAELLYHGQKIGFDDLRSGDKIVATINKNKRGIRAVVSDDEG